MANNQTITTKGNRGFTIAKSTGIDNSSYNVKGTEASTQLKNTGFGGSKDNLSHSITSGSAPAGK